MNAASSPLDITGIALSEGEPTPLGATWTGDGVNFAVYSSSAEHVELCIFDSTGAAERARVALPAQTEGVWHGFLPMPWGVPGLYYGYRVYGPYEPAKGLRYNAAKLVIDPYARALAGDFQWRDALLGYAGNEADDKPSELDSAPYTFKSVVVDSNFDWDDDHPPAVPWRDTVVYELHVKGFTQLHPGVPEHLRGTYLGLAHPAVIAYLKRLGITAVELLPVQACVSERFLVDKGLRNYWGYNSIAWFALNDDYAVADPINEFKSMVLALHSAGIEVILDVVFNHTAEGNQVGPTLNLRGFDNATYYGLDAQNPRFYWDRTGCGNTLAVRQAAARKLIIDCLKYWVEEMHVDGFRFDLAPVLGRDAGHFNADGAFFREIAAEPALRYVKLIAEPWDVGPEGYQLGHFPAGWSEWNDLYRDTMRGFWRGNPGTLGSFAERFAGSSDLFRSGGRRPTASVNFITCHDGFTLYDLVSYNDKHNEANLEDNRDGHNHNLSWNCGVEGPTTDPEILDTRARQIRNMLATLLLSQGVPMLNAGDEMGRTQLGNNNAYCQDNELNWIDWSLAEKNNGLIAFVRLLLSVRRQSPGLRRETFLKGARGPDREHKDVSWRHPDGEELTAADWHDPAAQAIGVLIGQAFVDLHGAARGHLFFLCNTSAHPVTFALPHSQLGLQWQIVFNTAASSTGTAQVMLGPEKTYTLAARSSALLADGLYDRRLDPRDNIGGVA
jgi:glycogen operon protein